MHPCKKQFSRGYGNPCPLQLKNFLSLAGHLHPHSFDLATDMLKLHDVLARLVPFRSAGEYSRPIGPSFEKPKLVP
jgi:hypothetical protein